ncbi:MAG: VCBS repeat-containing protein [Verrucomicrobiales bacterium]|nr:VCBS repeat-containing protein [Verrucomicrobiales bacterium]
MIQHPLHPGGKPRRHPPRGAAARGTTPHALVPARRVARTSPASALRATRLVLLAGMVGITNPAPSVTAANDAPPWPRFTDVTATAGIRFRHHLGDLDLSNIVEATGPGGLFFDYNNDGFQDIYFVNGRWHPDISDNRGRTFKGKLRNALYRNNGDGTFTDVTAQAGVGGYEDSYGMAASAADRPRRVTSTSTSYRCGRGIHQHRNNGDASPTSPTRLAWPAPAGPSRRPGSTTTATAGSMSSSSTTSNMTRAPFNAPAPTTRPTTSPAPFPTPASPTASTGTTATAPSPT